MKKLFLTSLLTLIAIFGMAQTTSFPITLTEADGLPGSFVVQNYLYQSKVFKVDKPVQKIRLTVCNTNTANNTVRSSFDGISANNGPGQPFFTMSEVRFFDENGAAIEFVATGNSVDPGDGGGYAALNDKNERTYLHTNYGGRCESMPMDYHYVEFELEKEVSSFSFSIQTRSNYYKNLITYMGVTGGSIDATDEELQYLPYPEQNFQLGKKVINTRQLATNGAFFVMQATGAGYAYDYEYYANGMNHVVTHSIPGNLYMRSPYEASATPSAANVFYLIPDADGVANTYRVRWLNSGRYIAGHTGGDDIWASWTREINEAASLTFEPSNGNFNISVPAINSNGDEFKAYLSYDGYGRMEFNGDIADTEMIERGLNSYEWAIYNATINGAAIANRLQAAIDEAEARIEAAGGRMDEYEEGEYDALVAHIEAAKVLIDYPDVEASEILAATNELNRATIAYATVSLWSFADSIFKIEAMYDDGAIELCEAPDWKVGAYPQSGFDALMEYIAVVDEAATSCESLADVDAAIAALYKQIDAFWATQITKGSNLMEIPFRVGKEEEGLPGVNTNSIFRWESPNYYLTEEIDAIRMTVFKTKSMRVLNGKPFVCLTELEFYDLAGNKIPMTEENYYTTSVANEGGRLAGLCDGKTTLGTHFHSQWSADDDYDGSEYFYLDITFPEPVSGFKYVQYGRGNGYDDVPTDFVFGYYGEMLTPEDVPFPAKEDPYHATLGGQITNVSQITEDGIYAIYGLLNCSPEYDGNPEAGAFYTSKDRWVGALQAPCAFSIRSTGDNDGTYYIQSLADCKYWETATNNDGDYWTSGSATSSKSKAGKFKIQPNNNEYLPNSFVIYEYIEDSYREVEEVSTQCPYVLVQDWGSAIGRYSVPSLEHNDKDGEGEWFIYKMTMDNPYLYWLNNAYNEVAKLDIKAGNNPGYYRAEEIAPFAAVLSEAQIAIETEDNALAAKVVRNINTNIDIFETLNRNPMVPGVYIVESANPLFYKVQGVKKALCAYYNDYEEWNGEYSADSEYSLWWATAPEDYKNPHLRYQFEFLRAVITEDAPEGSIYSELLAIWYEDSLITEEQLANAYFIKSLENGQFVSVSRIIDDYTGINKLSSDIGFTENPEYPYIVREQGACKFDIWCPVGSNNCLHAENHNNGAGIAGDIVHWNGGANEASSLWEFYTIATDKVDVIYTLSISGENGTFSGAGEYLAGTAVQLTAVPDTGYVFSGWYEGGNLLSIEPEFTYTITGNVSLVAKFEQMKDSPNTMGVKALRTFPGSTLVIPVEMNNAEDITAFQFDLYLPNGININTDEEGELMIALDADRKTSSHTLSYSQLSNGAIRVVAYSSSNKPFRGSEGALVNITTTIPVYMSTGDYQLTMKDIRLANVNEEEFVTVSKTSTISISTMRGDVNMDFNVTISDVVAVVNYILDKPTKVFNFMAADVTGDDKVSISDIVGIVNIILNPETEYSNGYNAKRAANDRSGDSTSMGEASAEAGSVAIPVSLNNANEYTAFQMDVELPEGATLASATLGSRAASSHSITWKAIADNKVRVVAYSVKNATFAGNAGELVTLNIEAAEGATGAVAVDNVRMATAEGVEMAVSGCGANIDINSTTGIGSIDAAMFKAYAEDGTLVVESGKEMQLSVYAANGRLVKIIDVTVGKNKFYNFAEGVYVINGVKVIIK